MCPRIQSYSLFLNKNLLFRDLFLWFGLNLITSLLCKPYPCAGEQSWRVLCKQMFDLYVPEPPAGPLLLHHHLLLCFWVFSLSFFPTPILTPIHELFFPLPPAREGCRGALDSGCIRDWRNNSSLMIQHQHLPDLTLHLPRLLFLNPTSLLLTALLLCASGKTCRTVLEHGLYGETHST